LLMWLPKSEPLSWSYRGWSKKGHACFEKLLHYARSKFSMRWVMWEKQTLCGS
jgi:hypothetical protein